MIDSQNITLENLPSFLKNIVYDISTLKAEICELRKTKKRKQWLKPVDVMELLGCGKDKLLEYQKNGLLENKNTNGRPRFLEEDVEVLMTNSPKRYYMKGDVNG